MNENPTPLADHVLLTQADEPWLKSFQDLVSADTQISIDGDTTVRDLWKMVRELDTDGYKLPEIRRFCQNLEAASNASSQLNLSPEITRELNAYRQLILSTLELTSSFREEIQTVAETENPNRTAELPNDGLSFLESYLPIDLLQAETSLTVNHALQSLAHIPLEYLFDILIHQGMPVLSNLTQSTEKDSIAACGNNEACKLAESLGYPFPLDPISQAEFIDIKKRKQTLTKLRQAGDLHKLAEYEHDCMTALLITGWGYPGSAPNTTFSIPELSTDKTRDCGKVFVQTAYWLKELNLNAFGLKTPETSIGSEGHYTFLVVDALKRLFLVDPAFHMPVKSLPFDLFPNSDIHQLLDSIKKGTILNFSLDVTDKKNAYEMGIHPRLVVSAVDNLLLCLFLAQTMSKITNPELKTRLFDTWEACKGNWFRRTNIPSDIIFYNTNRPIFEPPPTDALSNNHLPSGLWTHSYMIECYFNANDIQNGLFSAVRFVKQADQIIQNLYHAIEKRLQTDCAPGKNITPICLRFEKIHQYLIFQINAINCMIHHIKSYDPEADFQTKPQEQPPTSSNNEPSPSVLLLRELIQYGDNFFFEFRECIEKYQAFLTERRKLMEPEDWKEFQCSGLRSWLKYLELRGFKFDHSEKSSINPSSMVEKDAHHPHQ